MSFFVTPTNSSTQLTQPLQQPLGTLSNLFEPLNTVLNEDCRTDDDCADGRCDPNGTCNDEANQEDTDSSSSSSSSDDDDECEETEASCFLERKEKRRERKIKRKRVKKNQSRKRLMDITLGTSQMGLKLATASWKTLIFEDVHKQITYPMSIMKHVFLYLVKEIPILVMTDYQSGMLNGNYEKLSDSEMNIILNPTDRHVHLVNAEKKISDEEYATVITPIKFTDNTMIGVEFSGEGRRIFGHSTKNINTILKEYADINKNKLQEANYLYELLNNIETNHTSQESLLSENKIVAHNKGKFTIPIHNNGNQISNDVIFNFGTMEDKKPFYIIDEKYTNPNSGLKEKARKVTVRFNLKFHIHCDTNIISIGFNPLEYNFELENI
jgi:hypothetical protein